MYNITISCLWKTLDQESVMSFFLGGCILKDFMPLLAPVNNWLSVIFEISSYFDTVGYVGVTIKADINSMELKTSEQA